MHLSIYEPTGGGAPQHDMRLATLNANGQIQIRSGEEWKEPTELRGASSIALVADGLWAATDAGAVFYWNDETEKWVREVELSGVTLLTVSNTGSLHALQKRGVVKKRTAAGEWKATTEEIHPLANWRRRTSGLFRFSLRSLLLLIFVLAVVLGPVAHWYWGWMKRSQKQALAVAVIESNGGVIKYAHEFDSRGKAIRNPRHPAYEWQQSLFGEHAFLSPVELNWKNTNFDTNHIESLTTLQRVSLLVHSQDDIDRLGKLTHLRELKTSIPVRKGTQFDCDPLGNLTRLTDLDLSIDNSVQPVDLSFFEKLTKLKHVNIEATHFVDISGLESASQLETVSVWPAESLKGLGGSLKLTKVNCQAGDLHDAFSDLSGIEGAKNLVELNVAYSEVADLSPLSKLRKLEKLDLSETRVTDLSPLRKIKSLRELKISGFNEYPYESSFSDPFGFASEKIDPTIDLEPLIGLKNIHELDLSDRSISNKSILPKLTQVTKLTITGDTVFFWDVEKMNHLKSLTCRRTIDPTINRLALLTNLEDLTLEFEKYGHKINYAPLRALKKLKSLTINREGDFSFVASLPELTEFHFDSPYLATGINLTALAKHPKLKTITVGNQEISIEDFQKQQAKKLLGDD